MDNELDAIKRSPDDLTPETIRAIRAKFSESQQDFASRVGVSISAVCRWEKGQSKPLKMARRILTGLMGK